jgi:hypothetical protein
MSVRRNEMYVQSFPDSREKVQISLSGGAAPRWTPVCVGNAREVAASMKRLTGDALRSNASIQRLRGAQISTRRSRP